MTLASLVVDGPLLLLSLVIYAVEIPLIVATISARPATIGIASYVSLFLLPQARHMHAISPQLHPSQFGSYWCLPLKFQWFVWVTTST